MKTRNSTKSKLLSSVIALVLCVSMLIGATFAWFTDTASTAVNKIQAGNLDVQLLGADGNRLEGQTLSWQKAAGHENESLLWEPGCTYNLTPFKIKNNGNLALKYQISITGIVGNAELLNAIDFTVTGVTGATTAAALNGFEGRLAPNSETALITITGKMKTTAGNEYQGKSIDGIGITVRATQLGGTYSDVSGENDSFNNEYDKEATYPPLASYINNTTEKGVTLDGDGKTSTSVAIVIEDANAKSTIPAGTLVYAAGGTTPVATNDNGALNRDIKTTEATADSVTYDISYKYVDSNGTSTPVVKFGNVVENVIDVSTGLDVVKVTHTHGTTTTVMTPADNANAKADGTYYYDSTNGKLYVWSSEYSSFKIEYKSDFEAAVNGQGYATLKKAITVAHAASENVTVTLLKDVTLAADLQLGTGQRGVNLNLNGKTIDGGTHQVYTAGDDMINIFGGGTIKNNNTSAGTSGAALYILSGNTVELNDVSIEGNYTTIANYGNLTVKKANITGLQFGVGCFGSGTTIFGTENGDNSGIVVNSKYQAIATAVRYSPATNVIVYGGSYITTGANWDEGPIYWAGHGTLNVYGGTFKNATSGTGAAGVLQKNGTVQIHGGSFEAKDGIKIVAQRDSTEIVTSIDGGAFTGTRSGIYVDADNTTYMGQLTQYSVSIAKGNTDPVFNGGTEDAIYAKTSGLGSRTLMTITGGTFSSDPASYLAEGKMAVLGSDGMYTVENDPRVKTEEQLKAAIEAGGEVTLGADIPLTSTLSITKDVTLNLGTFTISGKDRTSAVTLENNSGTIKAVVNATTGGIRASGSNGNCFEMPRSNEGTVELTINGGNYSSTRACLVSINAGSTTPDGRRDKLFINGGTYWGDRIINANPANTEITITNGSLTATGYNYGITFGTNSYNAKLTMTGGSLKYENGSVIIAQAQGNTIDIRDNAVVTGKLSLKNCTMNITGGTVNITGGNTDNRAIMVSGGTTLNISGNAKVSGDPLFNMNGSTVNITGGMFKGKIVNGLNYGNVYLQSVKDLLTGAFSLSDLNGDGWYQVVPNE